MFQLKSTGKCFICNDGADYNCKACGNFFYLNNSHICGRCSELVHRHPTRVSHTPEKCFPQLELLSVLCIETSHYVCFSRDSDGRWLFFDSMADRVCELTLANEPLIAPPLYFSPSLSLILSLSLSLSFSLSLSLSHTHTHTHTHKHTHTHTHTHTRTHTHQMTSSTSQEEWTAQPS